MQATYAIAIRNEQGVPTITKQFNTYEDVLEFVQKTTDNAPVIMAMVQQEGTLAYTLVPVAVIKPGISFLQEERIVKTLEPTTQVVEVTQTVHEPTPVSEEVEINHEAPKAAVKKSLKRKQGLLVAGKHK